MFHDDANDTIMQSKNLNTIKNIYNKNLNTIKIYIVKNLNPLTASLMLS